jgi:hypothetical protein
MYALQNSKVKIIIFSIWQWDIFNTNNECEKRAFLQSKKKFICYQSYISKSSNGPFSVFSQINIILGLVYAHL